MKILIIGGTQFVGRTITESALKRRHDITHFNRGMSNPAIFEGKVDTIQGNRNDLKDLKKIDQDYDIVIDTCAYFPESVEISCGHLRNKCNKYVFISTDSVYKDEKTVGIDEGYGLAILPEGMNTSRITYENYGPLKVECESIVKDIFPERFLIIRPGYIVGPNDPFDRFSCWIVEASKKRTMICPGDGNDYMQFIDIRDLAEWIIDMIERNAKGIFNAAGRPLKFSDFIKECMAVFDNKAGVKYIPFDIIKKEGLEHCFPMYFENRGANEGYCRISNKKALSSGLKLRSYRETFRDIYDYHLSKGSDYKLTEGMIEEAYKKLI